MTPYEELQKKRAELLRTQEYNPSIVTSRDTAAALFDPNASQDSIDYQRALASKMLTDEAPQGRMAGNIFVPPNALEGLGAIAQKIAGGYALGKANERDVALTKKKESAASALAKTVAAEKASKEQRAASKIQLDAVEKDMDREQKLKLAMAKEAGANARAAAKGSGGGITPALLYKMQKDAEAASRKDNENTRKLATQINSAGIPEARAGIENFYNTIKPFEVKDEKGNPTGQYKDIPGLGGVQNIQGMVGNAATYAGDLYDSLSGKPQPKTGMDVKQAYTNVLNKKIKDTSGGQVTVNEWIRNLAAAGSTIWNPEMGAVEGMKEIQRQLDAQESTIKAGYDPSVVDLYHERVGKGSAPQPASTPEASAVGSIITGGDGKKYRIIGGDPNDPDVEEIP